MNTPKLRFKEFSGAWKVKKLGDAVRYLQSGKSKDKDENGNFVLYGSTGAIGFSTKSDYQGKNILIARVGANAGFLYEVDGDYSVSDNTLILNLNQQNSYSFFYNLLKYLNLNKLVFGSGQPLITGGQLKSLNIITPTLPEQTKIANFLTAIDDKINQLSQKVDLLSQYKKGVMQQIFSQQLRFKDDDGREFEDWEEKMLNSFLIERNTQTPKNDKYPLMAFVANKGVTSKGDKYNREFLVNDEEGKKYKQTEYGDFIYSSNNLETGSIGLNNHGSATISPVYSIFEIKKGSIWIPRSFC